MKTTETMAETPLSVAGQEDFGGIDPRWSNGRNGRPLVIEFSFRIQGQEGKSSSPPSPRLGPLGLFSVLQRMD